MVISYTAALNAPMLNVEQERGLIKMWQTERDRASMQALITSHARQVHACARRVNSKPEHHEDLVAEGLIGLIQAADRFEVAKDVRFSTYAHWWVLNHVRAANARLKSIVDVPNSAKATTYVSLQHSDGSEESLDQTLQSEDPTPEEHVVARAHQDEMRRMVAAAMQDLETTEQDIVIARNFKATPEPFEELAQRLGVGRDRLRQMERRALSRLKYALLERGLTTAWMV